MSKGWIKLYRKFLNWEWYGDHKVVALFIHCILKANHKEKKWRGNVIPRGTFITSYSSLSKETGLSTRELRTAFNKLESTGEIDKRTTSLNSWVTVVNYDDYQSTDKRETSERQSTDKRETTTNNDKNVKNDNNDKNKSATSVADAPDVTDEIIWQDAINLARHLKDSICNYDPTHKYNHNPPSLNRWVKEIDRAIRLDGRTPQQIELIIDYIFTRSDKVADFWKPNIQSGKKLRKHFDTIKQQIQRQHTNGTPDKLKQQLQAFD